MSVIESHFEKNIYTITFNRPEKQNSFDETLIAEFKHLLKAVHQDKSIRAIILKANGKNFCAGADLNWIERMAQTSWEKNQSDALAFAELLQQLNNLPQPTIAVVQGQVRGGGIGLIACCDIVIASTKAQFSFPEVKLGLIPATIAPYLIRSIGYSAARYYFLTGQLFSAQEAKNLGLLHHVVKAEELLSTGYKLAKTLTKNEPQALALTKQLLNRLCPLTEEMFLHTANLFATVRQSSTALERISAFLKGNFLEEKE